MRMTKQKQVVLDAVLKSFDHPTAETVLVRCKEELPSVNLATVYRNLNALANENKIRRIQISGGDRFDKTLTNHAHFKCLRCNSVFDIDNVDISAIINRVDALGDTVSSVELAVNGICQNCKNKS